MNITQPKFLFFIGDNCPPCRAMHIITQEYEEEYLISIEHTKTSKLLEHYNITSIPSLIRLSDNKRLIGLTTRANLEKFLKGE